MEDQPFLLSLSKYIGPIYIRQVRTKKTDWAKVWSDSKNSWYDTSYDEDTKETGSIWTGYDWWNYKSSSDTGIDRTIYGIFETYLGDGFVAEFSNNK